MPLAEIPVIWRIDVEPDARYPPRDRPVSFRGFEAALDSLARARRRIEAVTSAPARFTWHLRMDAQIAEIEGDPAILACRYASELATLEAAGDEIGLHTHAYRWLPASGRWCSDHGDQAWIDTCVRTSLAAYAGSFGRPCETFSFGNRWMNADTMALLERSGVRHDLTVEPGCEPIRTYEPEEAHMGWLPDYRRAPRAPYHPSRGDFLVPDSRASIWEIPLTTGRVARGFARAVWYAVRRPALPRPLWRLLDPSEGPEALRATLGQALAGRASPYLAMAVRSDAFADADAHARLVAGIEALLGHPDARRFRVCRPATAVAMCESLGAPAGSLAAGAGLPA